MSVESNSGYILLSQGPYSDYALTAFRVLKPFTILAANEEMMLTWKQTGLAPAPTGDEFIAFLNSAGYITDADELIEVHVGAYGEVEVDAAQANILFTPRKEDM